MKVKLMFGVIAAALGLSGCQKPPQDKLVVVRGQAYLIPWQDQATIDKESSIPKYIFIYPVSHNFPFKVRILYQKDDYDLLAGEGIPDLFGVDVTDTSRKDILAQLKTFNIDQEKVFCEKNTLGKELHYTCGLRVQDGDMSWSVNFDEKLINSAPSIKVEALKILKSYREAADAK
jgi:hypothetical protein